MALAFKQSADTTVVKISAGQGSDSFNRSQEKESKVMTEWKPRCVVSQRPFCL